MPPRPPRPKYQKTTIPLRSGVDQGTDRRVLPIDRLARVENAWQRRAGVFEHRHGFRRMTKNSASFRGTSTLSSGRTLVSTGDELCVVDNHSLWAYQQTAKYWLDRGHVGPAVGNVAYIHNSDHTYDQADSAENGDFVIHVARRRWIDDATLTNPTREVLIHVSNVTDQLYAAPDNMSPFLSSNSTTLAAHSVRAAFCADKLLAFYVQGLGSGADLRVAEWETGSPSINPPAAAAATITTNLLWQVENVRTYDAIGLSTGNYAVAYIDQTSQNIILETRNSSHVVQQTATISSSGNFTRVSICEDTDNGRIHVLAVADNGELPRQVETHGYTTSTLSYVYGPYLQQSIAIGKTVDNLGIGYGLDEGGTGRVQCSWLYLTGSSLDSTQLYHRRHDPDGTNQTALTYRWNLIPKSKPFFQNGRSYLHCDTSIASQIFTAPLDTAHSVVSPYLECSGLYEIDYFSGEGYTTFVGLWDVGTAPFATTSHSRMGACANVYRYTSSDPLIDDWRFSALSLSYYREAALGASRASANEVRLDFSTRPLAISAIRGTAVVGGSVVTWYDGTRTQELGHAAPPVPFDFAAVNGTGTLTTDTYSYQAVWESYDAQGLLHRSPPSLLWSVAVDNGSSQDTVELEISTMPATMRIEKAHQSAVFFRDVDGDRLRISEAIRVEENDATAASIQFDDINQPTGPEIYTITGTLDAIAPEGSRIPLVHGGRLCLGDPFRRERVGFSQLFAPGGAGDLARAPEFNEALGFVLPSGLTVSGMASSDDKWIVFSPSEIYAISGRGPADDGSADDHSGLQLISSDAGCVEAASVVNHPDGIMFQSKGGIYELSRGLQLRYVGQQVEDELAARPFVTSAVLVASVTQVRFTIASDYDGTDSRVLVYDYHLKQWYVWIPRNSSGATRSIVSACMHQGVYHFLESDGQVWYEDTTTWIDDVSSWAPLVIEAVWRNQGGWARVRRVLPNLRRESHANVTIGLSHDYEETEEVSRTWTAAEIDEKFANPDDSFELTKSVRRQGCEELRVRIEDAAPTGVVGAADGHGISISGITLEWLPRRGMPKVPRF